MKRPARALIVPRIGQQIGCRTNFDPALEPVERISQGLDQVFGVLEAHGEPDQTVGDTGCDPFMRCQTTTINWGDDLPLVQGSSSAERGFLPPRGAPLRMFFANSATANSAGEHI